MRKLLSLKTVNFSFDVLKKNNWQLSKKRGLRHALGFLLAVFSFSVNVEAKTSSSAFTVSSPSANATVSGTIQIKGTAGSKWVNIAAYDSSGNKLGSDVAPKSGAYALTLDTTTLAKGTNVLSIMAFSVAAGQSGGTSAAVSLSLVVNNAPALAPTAFTVSSPSANAAVSGTIQIKGTAGSQWVNISAYDSNGNKLGSDVTPSGGAYALTLDTTTLANGTNVLSIMAFSVAAGQSGGTSASVSLSLAVNNTTVTTPPPTAATGSFPIPLGVNTHLFYPTYLSSNAAQVQSMVAYLGITNIREVLPTSTSQFSQLTGLAAQGVNFNFVVGSGGTVTLNGVTSMLTSLINQFPGHLASIEGSNEVVNWPITYNGVGGLQGAANFQAAVYTAVRGNSLFNGIPVYDLTMGGGSPTSMPNLTNSCDDGNAHIYPQVSIGGGITPYTDMAANVPWETPFSSPKPNVVTESGYYTMPDNNYGVNNDVQARYTLDLIVDAISQGVKAIYLYDIVDDAVDPGNTNMEDHFGLFNSDYSPKPAATAIHNMTSVLNGTSVSSASYSVSGLPSTGHQISLTDSSGAMYLVVWAEPTIWNQSNDTESAAPTVNVTANLGKSFSTVQVYDPMSSASPINSYSNSSSVSIGITDHPLIIKMH